MLSSVDRPSDCRWPLWEPDGQGFYFTNGDMHGFDLWRYRFDQPEQERCELTADFDEDSVVFPAKSSTRIRTV